MSTLLLNASTAARYANATSLLADLRAALAQAQQTGTLPVSVRNEGSLLHVLDSAEQLVALMDFTRLRTLQSALLGAIAVDALARPEAATVALIGAAQEASVHLKSLRLVRSLSQVQIVDREPAVAAALAQKLFQTLSLPARETPDLESAVAGADIVILSQPAEAPLRAGMLRSGVHLNVLSPSARLPPELMSQAHVFSDLPDEDSGQKVSPLSDVFHLGWRRKDVLTVYLASPSSLLDAVTAWHVLQAAREDDSLIRFDFHG